ncbi:MAG: DUF1499 domain-containing protein [Desulfatibacillaceae bacterium]
MLKLLLLLPLAGVLMVGCAASPPSGINNQGRLAPCPGSPNCVTSEGEDADMACIPFSGPPAAAMERMAAVLKSFRNADVVEREDNYMRAEFKSTVFGFVDDVEIRLDDRQGCLHFRSASRSGYWDFGVNKKRMKLVRERFTAESSDQT